MSLTTVLHGCALLWWYTLVVGAIVIVHELGHYSERGCSEFACRSSASDLVPGCLALGEGEPIFVVPLYLLAGT